MENNKTTLRKIPLDVFLDALENLYNMGVDFVDITGTNDEVQDVIGLSFTEDYLAPDSPLRDVPDGTDIDMDREISLSDEDFNDLT
jgi:hypothetical protein